MTYSENAEDESIRELSNPEEQCGACPIDGLNAEECIDFFESMIAAITEPILVLNSDLKCVFANKNFSEMFGIEPSSIKNVSVFDIGNKLLDLKGLRDLLEELLSIHRDFDGYEVNLKLINIGERTMSLNATDVHQKNNADRLLLLSFFDITEQERAKKIQRLNEEKYKSIYETSRDAIMILEPPDWSFSAGNPATIRMFGCEDEVDFTSKQPWVLSPEYQPDGQVSGIKAKTMIERAIQNGSNYFEWTHKRLNGDEFPATVLLSRVELKGKTILQATVRDITGRKQVEDELSTHRFHLEEIVRERTAELEESEAKYRTLVEQSHDGIYIYGNDHFLFVNDRLCDLTSYTRDRLLNMKFSELLHTDERRMLNGDGTAKEGFSDIPNVFTVRLVRGDGELRHIEFSVRSFTYSGEDAILGIARDITILKKLENEQKKKEKLESLGLLAGGIAHNFNNFLTAIMGNISLARTMVEPGSDLYEILTNSEHAASKASNLPRQLLTFSMGGDPVRSRVSMGRIIRDSADFALSGSSTTAEYSIPDDLKQVFIDGEQIAQVINNIVTNAQQSMPDGGRVCIDAENILIHENDPLTIPEGQYIKIAISDNGIGIEDNHLNRVFDPFFTTKRNGTGLGLATAYSIIRKHSGYIKIKTKAGAGSTFTIYLPAELHSESSDAREPGPEKLSGGKILVMDDKELVRETVMIMLSRLGYEVDSASDGREAIVKYKSAMSTSEPFNAVILDLTVPNGLGGMETMEELQKIDPDITAVVSSGYSNAPVMSDYSVYGFAGVIMKPYSITQLSDLLRKVFNE